MGVLGAGPYSGRPYACTTCSWVAEPEANRATVALAVEPETAHCSYARPGARAALDTLRLLLSPRAAGAVKTTTNSSKSTCTVRQDMREVST